MMLLLRLFLLVMLIRDSSSADVASVLVEDCDKMACFVPHVCIVPTGDQTKMVKLIEGLEVSKDCDAIVKIRAYSSKFFLVVLESKFHMSLWIKLEQGTTSFECKRDRKTPPTVTAKYNNAEIEMIRKGTDKLLCEFFVKNDSNIFDSTTGDVKVSSTLTPEVVMIGGTFQSECKATCDPDSVKPVALGAVGDKTVSAVDVQLADLVCPADKKLMFRKDSASDFKETASITCKMNSEGKYEFEPKLVEAQCAVTTCTQCSSSMAPPLPNLETYDEGGCTKLRCKNNDRIKLGSAAAEEGSAECKFENNEHVWQLRGTTIKVDSTIECQGKVKCFSTEEDIKKVCKDCVLGPDNLPKCVGETAELMQQSVKMSIRCDDWTGKYILNDGTQDYTELQADLHCEDQKAIEDAAAAEAQKANQATMKVALCIALPLLGLGILVLIGFGCWRLRKRKAAEQNEKTKTAEDGQITDKKQEPDTPPNQSAKCNDAESKNDQTKNGEEHKKAQSNKDAESKKNSNTEEESKNDVRKEKQKIDKETKNTAKTAKQSDEKEAGISLEEHKRLVALAYSKGFHNRQKVDKGERREDHCNAGPEPENWVRPTGGRSRMKKKEAQIPAAK